MRAVIAAPPDGDAVRELGGEPWFVGTFLDEKRALHAGLERALLFTYPAMVVLAAAIVSRRRPPASVLVAIALTWAGVALAVGAFDTDMLRANARGSVYVLLCAATFATYFLVSERYTRRVGSLPFTVFAMTGAAVGLLA